MQFAKRILVFMAVNLLVVLTISIVTSMLGLQPHMTQYGINYESLAVFCLLWGMGGSLISLALSRVMAKWMMGVKLIDPQTQNSGERWLYETVQSIARRAGLPATPQIGIYESPEINAFATGPSKARSLVAVSSGLLQSMSRDEAEGVLAHEVAHIANGDMVTMTLIQGVVNAFVMFFARIIAFAISQNVDSDRRAIVRFATVFVLEIVFSLLGMIVVSYFSRAREFRADAGGARLAGREKMVAALQRLRLNYDVKDDNASPAIASLKISGRGGFMALLSTHPPLDLRIQRLLGR